VRVLALLAFSTGLLACDSALPSATTGASPDAGPVECLSDFPGLRVITACGADLRVVINGHEVPPTPRRLDVDGAVILPWPDWAEEGAPSVAEAGGASTSFTAHPYICQTVTLTCAAAS
jgi:hypothetical protein